MNENKKWNWSQHERNLNGQMCDDVGGVAGELDSRFGTGTRGEVLDRISACFPSILIISMAHLPNFRQLSSLLSTLIYICWPLSPQTAAAFRFIMFHNIHLAHVEEPRERASLLKRGNSIEGSEVVELFN